MQHSSSITTLHEKENWVDHIDDRNEDGTGQEVYALTWVENSPFFTHDETELEHVENNRIITRGAQTLGTKATKFNMVAPNLCASSVQNLLCVTLPAPRILRCVLDFRKICRLMIIAWYILILDILKLWENKQQWTK